MPGIAINPKVCDKQEGRCQVSHLCHLEVPGIPTGTLQLQQKLAMERLVPGIPTGTPQLQQKLAMERLVPGISMGLVPGIAIPGFPFVSFGGARYPHWYPTASTKVSNGAIGARYQYGAAYLQNTVILYNED